MGRKYTFQEVEDFFISADCELLENKYIDSGVKMKYKCSCGNISFINLRNFNAGKRCRACSHDRVKLKRLKNSGVTYEEVKRYVQSNYCQLLSEKEDFVKITSKLNIKCSCGSIFQKTYKLFQKYPYCKDCSRKTERENKSLDYAFVEKYFRQEGCELLETEYKNTKQKLRYRCICGEVSHIRFEMFYRRNQRCGCKTSRSKGEEMIESFLVDNNISYQRQYRIDECRNVLPLPFDFAVFHDTRLYGLIEYQGIQHYEETNNPKFDFDYRQQNDQIKRSFCHDNNIPLLEIPYNHPNQQELLQTFVA